MLLLTLFACNKDTDGDGVLDDFDCDLENADLTLEVMAWADEDGDGYGGGEAISVCDPTGMVLVGGDCDDADATISPDADELCDGIDNDCSGDIDENAIDQGTWYPDFDADGFGNEAWPTSACEAPTGFIADGGDCDDTDSAVNPDADEVCNGLDDNCDGAVDDETATDALTWYADTDGDGHGDADNTLLHCDWQEGYVALDDDCDDADPAINPAVEELCDGIDNDCDGAIDHDGWLPGDYSDLDDVMENTPDGAHVCLGEGTFVGGGYERYGSITLQGSGRDLTVIDADHEQFVTFDDSGDFGLIDLEITDAWTTDSYGYGAVVGFEESSGLVMRRVLISDAGCDSYYYCYAGVAYWDDRGDGVIEDVEVDGFTYDGDSYSYSGMYAMFYAYETDLSVDGLNVHDVDVTNVYWSFGAGIYAEYGQYDFNDLWFHDNHFEGFYLYSSALVVEESYGLVEGSNLSFEDNSFDGYYVAYSPGLYLDDTYGGSAMYNVEVSRNTIEASSYGYVYGLGGYAYYGDHTWENFLVAENVVEFENYGYVYGGLAYIEYGSLELRNADLVGNSFYGDTTVYGAAFYVYESDGQMWNVNVADNSFEDASFYGGVYTEDSDYTGGYNNVWNTDLGEDGWVYDDDDGEVVSSPPMQVDPGYADASNGDYTLGAGSALIDAGSPDILDADGSVSDVGAYGGPRGADW